MTEKWLPVVGYEGLYEVSDYGRVRSLDRTSPGSNGSVRNITRRLLLGSGVKRRYVALWRDQKQKVLPVSALVLEAFVGPRPAGANVLHYDDDSKNDTLSNLRWGTSSENMLDAVRNGIHPMARKTHCPQGHEYTPENTYVNARGKRNCRTCKNERARNKYHSSKEK